MKVSVNWLKQFTDVKLSTDELVQKIGAQLGAVEEVVDLSKKYLDVIVVTVVNCQKHPNADKLSVCKIDDGGQTNDIERDQNGLVQVVCGAPNVKEGMLACWLPPGTTVPSTFDKDPFVLAARELRGVMSNGMLASASELALGDNHSGIVELAPGGQAKPGVSLSDIFALNDNIIDIENKMFTHRPDCFGILGIARELAGIQQIQFRSPDWYMVPLQLTSNKDATLTAKVVDHNLVPRFMAVAIDGVTVSESPLELQSYLSRVGIRPINNIVDLTNYYMHLTGQPLHAYDADKLRQVSNTSELSLEARPSRPNEKILLLNGKELTIQDDAAIVIASNDVAVGLAGIMGGRSTEVDTKTKNIILECANFDMYSIRRTAMRYGLFTDAVTRFTKGQSVWQVDRVLGKAVAEVIKIAGGQQSSSVVDSHSDLPAKPTVKVRAEFVNARLGTSITAEELAAILHNVEFEVSVENDELMVGVPFWRTDISIAEDIVEEVARLYGYDRLPQDLPRRSMAPAAEDDILALKARLRAILSGAGANEVLTYSFVHGNLLEKSGQDKDSAFALANALSPDLQYYRLSIVPSLLDKVHANIKQGHEQFVLFEINQTHSKDMVEDSLPIEEYRLGLVVAADDKAAKQRYAGAPYYQAQTYLNHLLGALGISPVFETAKEYQPQKAVSQAAIAPFERSRAAIVRSADGQFIGELGELNTAVHSAFKLPAFTAALELDVKQLLKLASSQPRYQELSRYPAVEQDITLRIPASVVYAKIFTAVSDNLPKDNTFVQLSPLAIYQAKDNRQYKHISWRLKIASYQRTLKSKEVNQLLDDIAAKMEQQFGAKRI